MEPNYSFAGVVVTQCKCLPCNWYSWWSILVKTWILILVGSYV